MGERGVGTRGGRAKKYLCSMFSGQGLAVAVFDLVRFGFICLRCSWHGLIVVCVSELAPDSMGYLDPDPDSQSGFGSKRVKITHKKRKSFIF